MKIISLQQLKRVAAFVAFSNKMKKDATPQIQVLL